MALLRGSIFITDSVVDALLLEEAISHALAYRRDHGKSFHSERLFVLQTELHMLVETAAEVDGRRAAQLAATPTWPRRRRRRHHECRRSTRKILGKSEQMSRRDCDTGVLDARKVRGKWRIQRGSIEAHRAERSRASAFADLTLTNAGAGPKTLTDCVKLSDVYSVQAAPSPFSPVDPSTTTECGASNGQAYAYSASRDLFRRCGYLCQASPSQLMPTPIPWSVGS